MIITIGRQFGSGGKEIAEKVAQRLGYAFYDKEILTMAAEESGFSASAMQHYAFIWIPVGLLICMTVIAFNFVGDGLRDAYDPKAKR